MMRAPRGTMRVHANAAVLAPCPGCVRNSGGSLVAAAPRRRAGRRPQQRRTSLMVLSRLLPAGLALRLGVWWSRTRRETRRRMNAEEVPDFDMNVMPQMLPKRPPPGGKPYSVTTRMWRKIIYWARVHDKVLHGTTNRFAESVNEQSRGKVAVLGGGAFGTAMAAHVARRGNPVSMLLRNDDMRDFINRHHINPKYLSDFDLPPNLVASTDAKKAIEGCQVLIHAVPVQASRKALEGIRDHLPLGVPVVSVSKGLELGTQLLMCDLITDALGRDPKDNPVVVVSGPSFAKEIMDKRPTSVVAASKDLEAAALVQRLLTSPYFRVSITDDITGVEVAGALKNVLAIAAGISEGLGLGINAMSALVCQGAAEIRWLVVKMGGRQQTVAGLSGMGDILLTCFGSLSRNRTVGLRLGRGEPIEKILASGGGTAEGVFTAKLVVELADRHKVLMPVLTSVARILGGEVTAQKAVYEVMSLPPLPESA